MPERSAERETGFTSLRDLAAEARAALGRVAAPSSPEQDRDGLYYPLLFLTEQVEATLRHVLQSAFASVGEDNAASADWLRRAAEYADHSHHGRGDAENGPADPDCPCRDTDRQDACARTGCGFCVASIGQSECAGLPEDRLDYERGVIDEVYGNRGYCDG